MRERIFGLESEYGALIARPDGTFGPVDTTIVGQVVAAILGPVLHGSSTSAFLPNGARIYCDVGHVEGATAECVSVREIVRTIRGLDMFLEAATAKPLVEGNRVLLIRDNTDSATDDVCFASHENYLFDASAGLLKDTEDVSTGLDFRAWAAYFLAAHLVTRTIFTGAGIVSVRKADAGRFLLSHRARFIQHILNNSATGHIRPLILTRNEPLGKGPSGNYRRVQLTSGDPNIADVANYLKFGTTALVLRLAEEVGECAIASGSCLVKEPIGAIQIVNEDIAFRKKIECLDGKRRSALDIQEMLLELCARYFPRSSDPPQSAAETKEILDRWGSTLSALRRDPMSLAPQLDWPMKLLLVEGELADRYGIESLAALKRFGSERRETYLNMAKLVEQRYHELSPRSYAKTLRARGLQEVLISDDEAKAVMHEPSGATDESLRTRAWIRGKLIQWLLRHRQFGHFIPNWDYIDISAGVLAKNTPQVAIPLSDPFAWKVREALRIIALP